MPWKLYVTILVNERQENTPSLLAERKGLMKPTWTGLYVPNDAQLAEEPYIGPLTAEEYATQLEGLATFAAHPDVRCIWEFNPGEGPLLGLTLEPGANPVPNSDYWIVSPWAPGKLIVHSPVALRSGLFHFSLWHSILFDSNLFNRVVRFVETPEKLSVSEIRGIRALLEWLTVRKYDFQLMPYVIESYSKNDREVAYEHALRGIRAILRLHTMDRPHFLATGDVKADHERIASYEADFGTTNLDRIAEMQLEPYTQYAHVLPERVVLQFVALMKMVLIRRFEMPGRPLDTQWAAFDEFLFDRFGVHPATLRFVGALYFAGYLDKWITIQKTSTWRRARTTLTNCSWDLYLGSISLDILASCPEHRPIITHFCTREFELAKLLGMFCTYYLKVYNSGGFTPFVSFDAERLMQALGLDAERSLRRADERAADFSDKRRTGQRKPARMETIEQLRAETEASLRAFLQS